MGFFASTKYSTHVTFSKYQLHTKIILYKRQTALPTPTKGLEMKPVYLSACGPALWLQHSCSSQHEVSQEENLTDSASSPPTLPWSGCELSLPVPSLWPDNGLDHLLLFQKGLDLLARLQGDCIDGSQSSCRVVWVFSQWHSEDAFYV